MLLAFQRLFQLPHFIHLLLAVDGLLLLERLVFNLLALIVFLFGLCLRIGARVGLPWTIVDFTEVELKGVHVVELSSPIEVIKL